MANPVYVLGGQQTDFARNWTKEGKHISAMIREAVKGGLEVESRTGSDRRREEAGDEGEHLLAEGQAGVAGLLERGLKLRENSSSHGEAEDARLSHGGCLSREGTGTAWSRGSLQPSFS